jgi:glucokinase
LKLLEHRDIKEYIENKYRIPVRLENDANCFIVGEHICGAGKNYSDCVGLTLGTGIGCGIILDGQLRRGSTWHCGEIFDIKLGNNLVLEDILSARYITEQTGTVDAKESAYLANSGDKKSISVWNEYGKWLGWIISVINRVIDPEIFILGGSLSLSYNLFYKEMRRNIDNIKTKIVVSKLKEKSAVIGASLIK